jgi:hypothetical protein
MTTAGLFAASAASMRDNPLAVVSPLVLALTTTWL